MNASEELQAENGADASSITSPLYESGKSTEEDKSPMIFEDKVSICILLVLYTLQGIPMGLCGSIPLVMKERGVSFEGLALFSLVTLPFSLKLIWAPLVDSLYFNWMGRRKTWLVPVQLLCGAVMIAGSDNVDEWIGAEGGPRVQTLTSFFILLYFLMATQDISVDGWALTMLSRKNVGYASTTNSIGQSLGYFMANQGFIALNDAQWCERFLGLPSGEALVSLSGFMKFWGGVFIVATLLIAVFKQEKDISQVKKSKATGGTSDEATSLLEEGDGCDGGGDENEDGEAAEKEFGLLETYQQIWAVCKIGAVQQLSLVLLTCKVPFSPTDGAHTFKLQEYGMPKADIATVSPVLLGVGLLLPAVLAPYVSRHPLDIFLVGIPLKIGTSLLSWYMFEFASRTFTDGSNPGSFFFGPLIVTMVLHEMAGTMIFVAQMAFFNKISDPAIGGSYMTMLNTIANLGFKWPNALALWLLPRVTLSSSDGSGGEGDGVSDVLLDGYTVETMCCAGLGMLWLVFYIRPTIMHLKSIPREDWLVRSSSSDTDKKA